MPRSAAMIFGMMLVAFSIGVNTTRYPVVWEMVNPARATKSAQPTATPKSIEPERPAKSQQTGATPTNPAKAKPEHATHQPAEKDLTSDSRVSKPSQVKPVAEAASKIAAIRLQPALANGNIGQKNDVTRGANALTGMPLVPVTPIRSANAKETAAAGGAGIRRLPLVERIDPTFASGNTSQLTYGSIPVYPTTGIE